MLENPQFPAPSSEAAPVPALAPPAPGYASVFRPGLFAGQLIWVTGGGSGIGRCVAHELASLGAHVLISGRKAFQKPRAEGVALLQAIQDVYLCGDVTVA
jgi:hypothetical protein